MRLLILTQNENFYLPRSFAKVCHARTGDVACVVVAPAMSTHGGTLKGFFRHLWLFGLYGTARFAWRVIWAKSKNVFLRPGREGPFFSLKAVARAFEIPYHEVSKVNGQEFHALIDRYKPDLLISMSCPQIIGKKVRELFVKGCINVHGAPLPEYRGLMPAFWALRNNEVKTAATVHDLADKLDNGAILAQREVEITQSDTWDSLVRKTKAAGAEALIEVINQIEAGTEMRLPNRDEAATYFAFPGGADRRAFLAAGRKFFGRK